MKTTIAIALLFFGLAAEAANPTLDEMPPALETQLALAAVPPALRAEATVYLLDPSKGYHVSRQGTSGIECLVERTQWELGEFRDDLYIPLCYDAAGADILKAIRDTAELRARGMTAAAVKAEIGQRWTQKKYRTPGFGLSYMVAPIMRTIGPPDLRVHTMAMPHLMFYAPHLTNAHIGAKPDLANADSLMWPFIDQQGIPEQSYMIQMVGAAEKARILREEVALVKALCEYRDILCLPKTHH